MAKFGIPTPINVGQQLQGTIQLDLQFSLTAGDSASFTSVFGAEPIPEPATLGSLGIGLFGLFLARRRSA